MIYLVAYINRLEQRKKEGPVIPWERWLVRKLEERIPLMFDVSRLPFGRIPVCSFMVSCFITPECFFCHFFLCLRF